DAPYPNNPTDPTKPQNPSDPGYPVIPHVPGYTPVDPKDPNDPNDDVPLTPVDPNDPSKGYIPPKPEDPTKDRLINYEADNQKALIDFVTESGTQLLTVTENGESETVIPTIKYEAALNNYKKLGYEVVSDDFGGGAHNCDTDTTITKTMPWFACPITMHNFDTNAAVDQLFTVVLRERIEPFDPSTPPVPGQPVNPSDPNSPVWPDNVKDQLGTETVTRTVKYVYVKDNSQAAPSVAETLTFKRLAKVNLVTGAVTFDAWTAVDTTFDAVKSPVITGFIANKVSVAKVTGVQATDADSEVLVTYTALGKYVPNIPNVPNFPDTPYPNDPTDPTRPQEPKDPGYPVIPHVPGYTPVDPKDPNDPKDDVPLTPVDPNDPSKGYIPPTPEDPTKDTPINYVPNEYKIPADFPTYDLPELDIPVIPTELIVPIIPSEPKSNEDVSNTSVMPSSEKPAASGDEGNQAIAQLPSTGDKSNHAAVAGLVTLLAASILALAKKGKKEE
ncbi:mucin-binding protein, partial [Streptococcus orisasini]|uniref:mucin-binding protein n=1 Tax=Streptococcus orisasini TaxID=1080071 RepID=UPI000AB7B6E5